MLALSYARSRNGRKSIKYKNNYLSPFIYYVIFINSNMASDALYTPQKLEMCQINSYKIVLMGPDL